MLNMKTAPFITWTKLPKGSWKTTRAGLRTVCNELSAFPCNVISLENCYLHQQEEGGRQIDHGVAVTQRTPLDPPPSDKLKGAN